MTRPWGSPFPHQPHVDNHNEAHGGAYVGQQVGVNYGDTAFHNESTYYVNQGDPPERRHEVARNFLDGGAPREAEKIFSELLREGYLTTDRIYYYVLSLLSDRSFHELNGDLPRKVVFARKQCESLPQDVWSEAFSVVWRLMRFVRGEVTGEVAAESLEDVLAAYRMLDQARQDEIATHLGMVLTGVVKERLETTQAARLRMERMSRGRANRAWKYFEPDPAQPRPYVPDPLRAAQNDRIGVAAGGGAMLLGVVAVLVGGSIVGILIALPLVAASAYLLLRHGSAREAVRLRNAIKRREVTALANQFLPRSPGHWVPTAFAEEIYRLVDARFSDARPHVAGHWPGYTADIRAHLKERFVLLYGNARVTARSLNWLIRWHARQVAAGWGTNSLYANQIPVPPRDANLLWTGAAVGATGLLVLLLADSLLSVLLVGVGGFFAVRAGMRLRSLRATDELLRKDAEILNAAELHAYHEWVQALIDRPTDAEVARWLVMDKAYLRNDAVKRANVTAHDLVTHVVMTEGAPGAMRARVLHGPPRYSRYVVHIFLLTHSGVREARVELDFLTGEAWNEHRHLFRYGRPGVREHLGERVAGDER